MKWWIRLAIAALVLLLFELLWLGRLERGGPPHANVDLAGGIPATFTLPRPASGEVPIFGLPEPAPLGSRPPAIVLVHGFSGDRMGLSPLARSLAEAGYAVLAIDVRGHGENRNSMGRGTGNNDGLVADIGHAVDFLRTSPHVDGSRISVGGHSMGAGASLAYGGRDSGLDALILIAGGGPLLGPQRPPNVLLLYAEDDPDFIKAGMTRVAGQLSGDAQLGIGENAGDFAKGTRVRLVEIPQTDHLSILIDDVTVMETVAWLDSISGVERASNARIEDPRLRAVQVGNLALTLLLPGLGIVLGRLAPRVAQTSSVRAGRRIGLFAAAFLVVLPLCAVPGAAEFLPLAVADSLVQLFAYAGVVVLAMLASRGDLALSSKTGRPLLALAVAGLGFAAIYAFTTPLNVAMHRLALGPERAVAFAMATLGLLPFCFGQGLLLRRGTTLQATLASVAGHVVLLAALVVGIVLEILPGVLGILLPILGGLLFSFELLATGIYAASRNIATIAVIESLWLAWFFAAVLPYVG
ncbi:MAG: alpha/beta fold hydrolase [Myxococcota bacterium]